MPLQKQNIDINLAQGIETQVDDKVLDGKNLIVENATFNKFKALQKCKGHSKISHTTSSGGDLDGSIKSVGKVSDHLYAVDSSRNFYRQNKVTGKFDEMSGSRFPAKLRKKEVSYVGESQKCGDIAYNSRLEIYVASFVEDGDVRVTIRKGDSQEVETYSLGSSSTVYQQRIHILDDGTDVKILVLHTCAASGGIGRASYFDYEMNHLSTVDLSASSSNGPVSSCQDGNDVYFTYQTTTAINISKLDFAESAVSTSTTPTGLALNSPISCSFFMGQVWFSWTNYTSGTIDVYVQAFGDTLASTTQAETKVLTRVDRIADRLIVFSDGSEIIFLVEARQDPSSEFAELVRSRWSISGTSLGSQVQDLYRANMSIASEPVTKDGYTHLLLLSRDNLSQVQSSDSYFFCRLEDYEVGGSTNLKPVVLGKTSRGLAAGVTTTGALQSPPKLVSSGDMLTTLAFEFRAEGDVGFSFGSDIYSSFQLSFDMGDFGSQEVSFGKGTTIAAGLVLDMCGEEIVESGFFLPPAIVSSSATSGSISAGTRSYKAVFEYINEKGEQCYSAVSNSLSVTNSASEQNKVRIKVPAFGEKMSNRARVALFRTKDAGTIYYRVASYSSQDPLNPSVFYPDNFSVEIDDNQTDSAIESNEILYTEGEIENDSPPQAESISSGGNRIILGSLNLENEIGYSKLGLYGVSPSFSDFYRIAIDSSKLGEEGRVEAVGHIDDKILLFKPSSIYYIIGNGPANNGQNDDFSQPQSVSFEIGCIERESVLNIPDGIVFKSKKGFYFINRALNPEYIGNSVHDFDSVKVKSSIIVEEANEARFYLESGHTLVYHYLLNEWDVFTYPAQSAVNINGEVYFVSSGNIYKDDSGFQFDGSFYSMKVRTPWLKLATMQGYQRIWRALVTGNYKSPHELVMRIYFDYDESTYEEHTIDVNSSGPYSLLAHIANQKCTAIMFEIFDNPTSGGESVELNTLTLEVGIKKGVAKLAGSKRF